MGLLNNPSENKQILSGNRKGLLFSNIEAVDNFFTKNAHTNHSRRKLAFLRRTFGIIQPAALPYNKKLPLRTFDGCHTARNGSFQFYISNTPIITIPAKVTAMQA